MPEIKAHEFDRLLRSSGSLPRIMLFFGPDRGMVSELARQAAGRTGVPLSDPFALTRLDPPDLQKDHGRLADEMNSIGLFGGEKLIWVKDAGNEKHFLDALSAVAETVPEQAYLIIEAGDLKKTAGLRKIASGSRNVTAIPCYADDTRGLNQLIDSMLSTEGKKISPAGRAKLLENIGGDHLASRGEIAKLLLYCRNDPLIEEHHVEEIIGDASAGSIDDAIDAILSGDRGGLIHALNKVMASKTPIYQLLNGVLRQFQQLDTLRAEMDRSRMSASQAVAEYGKQIFFKRKPAVTAALTVWTAQKLYRETARLQATVLSCQKNPMIAESIATQLLLSLAIQSSQRN